VLSLIPRSSGGDDRRLRVERQLVEPEAAEQSRLAGAPRLGDGHLAPVGEDRLHDLVLEVLEFESDLRGEASEAL
jgi:hypothetical protein